jgi:hypothetical protein
MTGEMEIRDILRAQGFIDRKEAAALLGRVDGGSVPVMMQKLGVRSVSLGVDGHGDRRMYLKSDVLRVKPQVENSQPVGGESNGGRLHKRIRELEARVEALEQWKQSWE